MADRLVTGVIDAIQTTTSKEDLIENAIRVHIKRAQSVNKVFPWEMMSFLRIIGADQPKRPMS